MNNKRKKPSEHENPSMKQKQKLMELVATDSVLSYKPSRAYRSKVVISGWDRIAEQLNSMPGVAKSGLKWKNTWRNLNKRATKTVSEFGQDTSSLAGDSQHEPTQNKQLRAEWQNPFHFDENSYDCQETDEEITQFSRSAECCRQMIRVVAQGVIHEKKSLGQALAKLCKQSNPNCKKLKLWHNMQVITMTKLNNLLRSQDRVGLLHEKDRMNITDWLLFDTVLVHQNFNVIGSADTAFLDNTALVALYELVARFQVEHLVGDELAEAWCMVTMNYNKLDRESTPMLLQRRWYQLKLCTRNRFVQFWNLYRGVKSRLSSAKPYAPTKLQIAIAKRYPLLLLEPFILWEDLIKAKRVILRQQFELIALQKREMSKGNPPAASSEPRVLVTISLDKETDSKLEEKQVPSEHNDSIRPTNSNENMNMDIESIPDEVLQENTSNLTEEMREVTAVENSMTEPSNKVISKIPSHLEIGAVTQDEEILPNDKETEHSSTEICVKSENDFALINDDIEIEETVIVRPNVPAPALPQITNIFGNVHVPIETLSKITALSNLAKQINKSTIGKTVKSEPESERAVNIDIATMSDDNYSIPETTEDESQHVSSLSEDVFDETSQVNSEVNIKPQVSALFGEFSNEINSVDDRIHLLNKNAVHTENSNQIAETDVAKKEKNESAPTTNKNQRRVLRVYTVKLDDMGILPLNLLKHVDNKNILDIINFKSKPVMNYSTLQNVKDTINVKSKTATKDSNTSCCEDVERVNISSIIFQKPQCRQYNPVQLWKHPDFNTKLRNLSTAFYKRRHNQTLLAKCRPLTINLSKFFEKRLVNGRMYLKTGDDDKNVKLTKNNQNATDITFNTAVERLVEDLTPMVNTSAVPDLVGPSTCVSKSNKITNSSEVSETCHTNLNHLTTAPLQLNHDNHQILIVVPEEKDSETIAGKSSMVDKTEDKNLSNSTLNTSSNNHSSINKKKIKQDSRNITKSVRKPNNINMINSISPGILFNLDTVNSLFNLLSRPNTDFDSEPAVANDDTELTKTKNYSESTNTNSQLNKLGGNSAPRTLGNVEYNSRLPENNTGNYCCWARERLVKMQQFKNRVRRHDCTYLACVCCCNIALSAYCNRMVPNPVPSPEVIKHTDDESTTLQNTSDFEQYNSDNDNSNKKDVDDSTVILSDESDKSTCDSVTAKQPKKSIKRKKCATSAKNTKKNRKANLQSNEFREDNVSAQLLQTIHYTHEKSFGVLECLGKNEILLSTSKFPPNFKTFLEFERSTRQLLALSDGIQLNMLPNGRVSLNRHPSEQVSQKLIKSLSNLVQDFYQKNVHSNIQSINKTREASYKDVISKITDEYLKDAAQKKNWAETKSTANFTENNNNTRTNVNMSVFEGYDSPDVEEVSGLDEILHEMKPTLVQTKSPKDLIVAKLLEKLKSGLGYLLFNTLTPITCIAELNYARSQNGLFLKFDFNKGLLKPINVYMKAPYGTETLVRTKSITLESTELGLAISTKPKPAVDVSDDNFSQRTESPPPISSMNVYQSPINIDEGLGNDNTYRPRSLLKHLLLEKQYKQGHEDNMTPVIPQKQEFEALVPDQNTNVSGDSSDDEPLNEITTNVEPIAKIERETYEENPDLPVEGVSFPGVTIIEYLPTANNENTDDVANENEASDEDNVMEFYENVMTKHEFEEEDCILGV